MRKIVSVFIFLHCIPFLSFAQNQHLIDSLEGQWKKLNESRVEVPRKDDTLTVKLLHALSIAYWYHDVNKAMDYSKHMLAVSERISYKKGMGNAYNNIGSLLSMSGEYVPAMENFNKALKIRTELGDKKQLATTYNNIGNTFNYQGNFPEAIKNYFTALKISEEAGDKLNIARGLTYLASVYGQQANYPEINIAERDRLYELALRYNFSALSIREELEDKSGLSYNYNSIGSIYRLKGNYSEALNNYKTALKIAVEIADKRASALVYGNIGSVYAYQNQYKDALKFQTLSLNMYDEIGDKKGVAGRYSEIGTIFLRQNMYVEAISNFNKALQMAKPISDIETIRNSYDGLTKADSANGRYKSAFGNLKFYVTYRDSLINGEKSRLITRQQMQFDFDKKQLADSIRAMKEKQAVEVSLQKQKAFTISGFIGAIVAIVLLFFVYKSGSSEYSI